MVSIRLVFCFQLHVLQYHDSLWMKNLVWTIYNCNIL